ncbi:MAG: hypothetical protein QT00_C0001G0507 [archaeon GW2011_AR5]|nr:MAG: hypothetical protein QT00_C0001G0507 [archaeon GW2011_AR5]
MKIEGFDSEVIRELVRRGVEARLHELKSVLAEVEKIRRLFPDIYQRVVNEPSVPLKTSGKKRTSGAKPRKDIGVPQKKRGSKRRGMSAAERKAVGERMRKYWAERRKEKEK